MKHAYKTYRLFKPLAAHIITLTIILFSVTGILSSCKNSNPEKENGQEDTQAKKDMQGVWIDKIDGDVVFRIKGDTLYYPDQTGEPVAFYIVGDTLFLKTSTPTRYSIKHISENAFRFVNTDGDEMDLIKSKAKEDAGRFERRTHTESQINQGLLIKRDSVLTYNDKRFHAYVQVNPTRYKVMKQNTNDDGMRVENAYYDNIIHISVFEGQRKVYSHNIQKTDFAKQVPVGYLEHSILSDILIKGISSKGVTFEAIITEPESYTSYQVFLTISEEGKVSMSYEQ